MDISQYHPSRIYVNGHTPPDPVGDFHFVMGQDLASEFKHLYDGTLQGNPCKHHFWMKNYVNNFMHQQLIDDDIIAGIHEEVARKHPDGDDVMKTYRALGALLTYPTEALVEGLSEIVEALDNERMLSKAHVDALRELCVKLEGQDLMDLQDGYVRLFDRTRSMSLHLYEHLYGEARERGQAMVRLQTLYKFHGFSHTSSELPDFLPLFAEFLSLMPDRTARTILSDAAPVIEALRLRATEKETPYAAVISVLVSLASKLL